MNGEDIPQGFKLDKAIVRMVFDAVLALVVAVVGFVVTNIHADLREMKSRNDLQETALAALRERLPLEYVRLDIYLRDRQEMRQILDRIDTNVREHRERAAEMGREAAAARRNSH